MPEELVACRLRMVPGPSQRAWRDARRPRQDGVDEPFPVGTCARRGFRQQGVQGAVSEGKGRIERHGDDGADVYMQIQRIPVGAFSVVPGGVAAAGTRQGLQRA